MKTTIITLGLTFAILLILVVAMAFRPLFVRNGRFGKFPDIHIGSNKEMRKRGIKCVNEQDREARERSNDRQ
ncbi:MAG: hypothetical protein MJZ95_05995 [Paludibacteraceae bacterium]|nr:hypothetical protein [Paludibacteraceae bacterium]